MKEYSKNTGIRPRVLGLTPPMLDSGCDSSRLDWELSKLEKIVDCRAETASDIVSVLRYIIDTLLQTAVFENSTSERCSFDLAQTESFQVKVFWKSSRWFSQASSSVKSNYVQSFEP